VIYDSGAVMLDKVRRAMGDDDFYTALRAYYKTYQGRRATSANLQTMLQKHSRADLKPIFASYLAY
jgi:aminopeptidase N